MGTGVEALLRAAAVASLLGLVLVGLPASAEATAPQAVKRYQVCWWRIDHPADSFECRESFRGGNAVVRIPTGSCWSNDQQGGTTQIRRPVGWVNMATLPVQYQTGPYCTDPEIPYSSYIRLTTPTADYAVKRLRFLIPFNEGIDVSATTVVCVRWIRYKKFCRY